MILRLGWPWQESLTDSQIFQQRLFFCFGPTPVLCTALAFLLKKVGKSAGPVPWADGAGWKGVYDIMTKDGYNVSIVQEPETSFKEDVAATKRVMAQQDGPCLLVGHSYGGAVIT